MNRDERRLFNGLVHLVDAILQGLAIGISNSDWQTIQDQWLSESEDVRKRINEAAPQDSREGE